jgi:hypothetical protein
MANLELKYGGVRLVVTKACTLAFLAALPACPQSDLVSCGELICAADDVCVASGCTSAPSAEACADQAELSPCSATGVDRGFAGAAPAKQRAVATMSGIRTRSAMMAIRTAVMVAAAGATRMKRVAMVCSMLSLVNRATTEFEDSLAMAARRDASVSIHSG